MPPKKGKTNIIKSKKNATSKIVKNKEKGLVSADESEIDKELSINEASSVSSLEESEYENLSDNENEEINDNDEPEETDETEESEEESDAQSEAEDVGEGDEENCFYKYVSKKKKNIDDDEDDEEEEALVFDDDNKVFDEIVKPEERVTKPFLTKFERVRLLGDRAKQLSLGAKPMLKNTELLNPKEIARLELEKKVIPLIIERTLPNGKKERWNISELSIVN